MIGRFISELKRRNVLRLGAFYAGFSWLLVQVATQVFPFFGIPDLVVRIVVVSLVVALPFVLLFGWFYELTPDGLKLESEIDRNQPISHSTGSRLDRWLVVVLSLAVVLLLVDKLLLRNDVPPAEKSIAVLPLLSHGSEADAYLADGLSEELISQLTQLDGLKVIGRASSFQFREAQSDLRRIGELLGVSTLLTGSLRRQAGQLRVVAELVRIEDGRALWSQTYERNADDVFAVQTDIAHAVAAALEVQLLAPADRPIYKPDPRAHELVLEAHVRYATSSQAELLKARDLYQQAIVIDPGYAEAHAWLANTWRVLMVEMEDLDSVNRARDQAKAAIARAVQLDEHNGIVQSIHGIILMDLDFDLAGARRALTRAVELNPGAEATRFMAYVLATAGEFEQAEAYFQRAMKLDPLQGRVLAMMTEVMLLPLRRYDEAERAMQRARSLPLKTVQIERVRTSLAILRGDAQQALELATSMPPDNFWRQFYQALALSMGDERAAADAALQALIAEQGEIAAYQIAEIHAFRGETDRAFEWLQRAQQLDDPGLMGLLCSAYLMPLRDDPRFDALRRKVGLPQPPPLPAT